MQYSIGKVAKLMGMSIEGIRKYEQYGIISSKRIESNQYRFFDYLDITSLIHSRNYRAFGFSIQEVEKLINKLDLPEADTWLRRQQQSIETERLLLKHKQMYLNELLAEHEKIFSMLHRVEIFENPAYFRFEFSKNGEIDLSKRTVQTFQRWMSYTPFINISTRYQAQDTFGGLIILAKYARLYKIEADEDIQYIPASLCIQTYGEETDSDFAKPDFAGLLQEFAEKHHFQLEGDTIGYSLGSVHKSSCYKRYRKIFARISY